MKTSSFVLLVFGGCSAMIALALWLPSAISIPTRDWVCTQTAVIEGQPKCVEYRRKPVPAAKPMRF